MTVIVSHFATLKHDGRVMWFLKTSYDNRSSLPNYNIEPVLRILTSI